MRKNVQNASSAAFYYSLNEKEGGPALLGRRTSANGGAVLHAGPICPVISP